ncbi:malonate decarboxylase holo-ACP synthase [Mycobacterium sp. GA-2829]|uniref:malonate decarboxylase holo-ACP synthase n=1 Tax=Mycobacterium sp. GA-2829 TaxID=1772283 RepID=UPI00073FF300|nr:malonate decarboxylase holo-ACP synthase [Mycobacterium sp. GA-2829]KUI26953.1 phosphoribosyl-dephospho-CoA transferase [Mycobacterium sp. GA-2829]
MTTFRAHDLLRIAVAPELTRDAPAWVAPELATAPWVVVRRARCAPGQTNPRDGSHAGPHSHNCCVASASRGSNAPGRIPVGVRGAGRGQRYATEIDARSVLETRTPADLLESEVRLPDVPAASALDAARNLLGPTGLWWGPAGSTGFTLATGVRAVTDTSDLDLVVRVHRLPPYQILTAWHRAFARFPARVDCQLDLPAGAVALADVVQAERVLLRTVDGPVLIDRKSL